jgi:7-cyano-7-deazaguanine synthase
MKESVVVLASGGMDSAAMLWRAAKHDFPGRVLAVSFNYGQRHGEQELAASARLCELIHVPRFLIDLTSLGAILSEFSGSALVDPTVDVPEGHYAHESMKATVVPNRNMVMLAIATSIAVSAGYNRVGYAAHAGDHAIYPDCRPPFMGALDSAIRFGNYGEIHLWTPYMNRDKSEIVADGQHFGVPWPVTYSCYNGRETHCGRCGTCVERKEAFELAGVKDQTIYEGGSK